MADKTNIDWADSTFNPFIGCTKVSQACDHCYAERDTKRFGRVQWGAGQPRVRTSAGNWKKPLQWDKKRFMECGSCGWRGELEAELCGCPSCNSIGNLNDARRRVFCASLADVFDNEVDPAWRRDLFNLIVSTPALDWMILTKRIGNAARMIEETLPENMKALPQDHPLAWPWPNVWIGATICNQKEADRDIPKLLEVPAAVRFLSIEPMLGAVDLRNYLGERHGDSEAHGGVRISSGLDRGSRDRPNGGDMEGCGSQSRPVERWNEDDPMPQAACGARGGIPICSSDGERCPGDGTVSQVSVAPLQWPDSDRYDSESQEREQERQQTGELGACDTLRANEARHQHSWLQPNAEPRGSRAAWVIVGGESGPDARPMHPDWARSLRDQCAAVGVPLLFKQWGEWAPEKAIADDGSPFADSFRRNAEIHLFDGGERVYRVGKKRAGRLLDGTLHHAFPEPK